MERTITVERTEEFKHWLEKEQVNDATIVKYSSVIERLGDYLHGREVTQELLEAYKSWLVEDQNYKKSSANSFVFTINHFCRVMDWGDLVLKGFSMETANPNTGSRYIDRKDYETLVTAALGQKDYRLAMVMQTLCHMDLRFSEFGRLTVEAVEEGMVEVVRGRRTRKIDMPDYLREALLGYAKRAGVREGMIFRTRSGRGMNRSNVWKSIKKLCGETGVDEKRVSLVKFKMPRMHDYYPFYGEEGKKRQLLGTVGSYNDV
jgi:site-specific recombinase XerD